MSIFRFITRLWLFCIACSTVDMLPLVEIPLTWQQLDPATGNFVDLTKIFTLQPLENPRRAVIRFCWKEQLHAGSCDAISGYLLSILQRKNESLVDTLAHFDDDIIMHPQTPVTGCGLTNAVSYLDWGVLRLQIDLSQLGGKNVSDFLTLPAFDANVDTQLQQFCQSHSLKGIRCRELSFEVESYLTSLYYRSGGVNLRNMMASMYYQDYLQYVLFTVEHNDSIHYFAQYPSHFLPSTVAFCAKHRYNRTQCTEFMLRADREINQYYEQPSTELSYHVYILRALEKILAGRHPAFADSSMNVSAANVSANADVSVDSTTAHYIDADFIEIGTSDFNTITQLINDADPLIGFAVEPSMHYLSHLPDKTGVTKVNCAIVPAHSVTNTSIDTQCVQSIEQFLGDQHIRRIRLLKINAGRYDVEVLNDLYHYLVAKNNPVLCPERILVESIPLAQREAVDVLISKYTKAMNYKTVMVGNDVILERILHTARQYVTHALDLLIMSRQAELAAQPAVQPAVQHGAQSGVTIVTASSDFIDADFIEIGTSNFDTITQYVLDSDHLVGFAVEPSAHYLSSLPDRTGVTKVNCAIVPASTVEQKTVDLYHIPEAVIEELGLPTYLKGCNSIGSYHHYHRSLNLTQHVVIDKVPAYTIEQLLTGQKIRRIRLLKIDAEGYDMTILDELYHYIAARNDLMLYPERIVFESNDGSQDVILQDLLLRYKGLGYVMVLMGVDTVIERLHVVV